MRVLLCNYRYFVSGGPERYMFNITHLLEIAGHEVVPFSVRYPQNQASSWADHFVDPIAGADQIRFEEHGRNFASAWRGLERLFYSREVYDAVCRLIDASKPDVAYVLHYLRKLSPAVLAACADKGVPVVVRLSDFQMLCPAATMMRAGLECDLCIRGSLAHSVWHKCVKGSVVLSSLNAAALTYQRAKGYFSGIGGVVCPTLLMQETMEKGAVVSCPIRHIPSPVEPRPTMPASFDDRELDVVYVGRLDPEKGVGTLLAAHRAARTAGKGFSLKVIGDGGDRDSLRGQAHPDVVFTGFLSGAEISEVLARAKVCAIPSVWPENLPNVLLESWACGTPVVASGIGSLREVVGAVGGGCLATPADPLSLELAIAGLLGDSEKWLTASLSGYAAATTAYSPAVHLAALMEFFGQTISAAR